MNFKTKTPGNIILACSISCLSFIIPQNKAQALVIFSGSFSSANQFSITDDSDNPKTTFKVGDIMVAKYLRDDGMRPDFFATGDNSGPNDMGMVDPTFPARMLFNEKEEADGGAFKFTTPVQAGEAGFTKSGDGPILTGMRLFENEDVGQFSITVELFAPGITPSSTTSPLDRRSTNVVPEPLTILGSVTALGIGAALKKKHSRKLQEANAKA